MATVNHEETLHTVGAEYLLQNGLDTSLLGGAPFCERVGFDALVNCMLAIGTRLGYSMTKDELAAATSSRDNHSTFAIVNNVSNALGLNFRYYQASWQQLKFVATPAVVHITSYGYAILKSATSKKIKLITTDNNLVVVTHKEFLSASFFIIELFAPLKTKFARPGYWWWPAGLSVRGKFSVGLQLFSAGVALEILSLVIPLYGQISIDYFVPFGDLQFFLSLTLFFLAVVCVRVVAGVARGWSIAVVSGATNVYWMGALYHKLLQLPLSFFNGKAAGDISARFNGVFGVQSSVVVTLFEAFFDGLLSAATLAMMFYYSWRLAIIPSVAIIAYLAVRYAFGGYLRQSANDEMHRTIDQTSFFLNVLKNIQYVKVSNSMHRIWAEWSSRLIAQKNASMTTYRYHLFFKAGREFIMGCERLAVIGFGCLAVSRHTFTIGMLFAFLSFREHFTARSSALIDRAFDLRSLGGQLSRVREIVEAKTDSPVSSGNVQGFFSSIELRNLSFKFRGNKNFLFKSLNLKIESGEIVAISGSSGAGKSTLLKLFARIYDGYDGQVLLDGRELSRYSFTESRDIFSSIFQEDNIFDGTIFQNICFYDECPDTERVHWAAEIACIKSEIDGLSLRFNSSIGSDRPGMSHGQKKRILIARSIYRRSKVLVLDETLASLDKQVIDKIISNLRENHITAIIASHDEYLISCCDSVMHLDGPSH